MKNLRLNTLRKVTILVVLSVIILLVSFYLPKAPITKFLQSLIPTLLGSFFFGCLIFLFEQKFREEVQKKQVSDDINVLKKIIKRMYERNESSWNFSNHGPSFYFDGSRFNQLHDILTNDHRYWENKLLVFKSFFGEKDKLVNKLVEFLNKFELALIHAENLDNELKSTIIAPENAAEKGQFHHEHELLQANENAKLKYFVFRASWLNINSTQILFGVTLSTTTHLPIIKLDSLSKEAQTSLEKYQSLNTLLKIVLKDRAELMKLINRIKIKKKMKKKP